MWSGFVFARPGHGDNSIGDTWDATNDLSHPFTFSWSSALSSCRLLYSVIFWSSFSPSHSLSHTHYYNNFSSFTSTNGLDMRTNQLSEDRCYVCFHPLFLSLVRQFLVYRSQFCVDFTNRLKQLTVYPRFGLICFHDRGSIYLGKTGQRQALHHHPQLPGKKYHTQTRIFNGGFMCVISRYSTAIL